MRTSQQSWILAAFLAVFLVRVAGADEPVQSWSLEDGTEVLLVEDHRAPMVSVRLYFPAGTHGDWAWENHAGTAMRIQTMDPDGLLHARADELAADVGSGMSGLWAEMNARCRKEDLPAVLGLLQDTMANRDFDRTELRRWRRSSKAYRSSREKNISYCGRRATYRLLFDGDDPRLRELVSQRLPSTDAAMLAQVRDTVIRLPGRRIGFAGDLTRAEVEALVAELLPPPLDQPPEGLAPAYKEVNSVGPAHDSEVTIPRLTQVYFAFVRDSIRMQDDDFPAFLVANHVLGGHFYSRLSVALRHEGGETYGAGSGGYGIRTKSYYGLTTYTHTANVDVADTKLRDVLHTMRQDGITEEERVAALANLRGRLPFSQQSPDQILAAALFERHYGLSAGIEAQNVIRAEALTLEELNTFIREFFDPSLFTMIHIAPE